METSRTPLGVQGYQTNLPSANNLQNSSRLFEDHAAVMGFKCQALMLQGQLKASQLECEKLRAQVTQQQQQSLHDREQATTMARMKQEKDRLDDENKNLKTAASILEEEMKELKKKETAAVDTIKKRDEEITRLQAQCKDHDDIYKAYQKTADNLQVQLDEIRTFLHKFGPPGPVPAKRTVVPKGVGGVDHGQVHPLVRDGLPDERIQHWANSESQPPQQLPLPAPPQSPPLPRPSQMIRTPAVSNSSK